MKQLLALITVVVMGSFTLTMAQGGGNFDPAAMKQRQIDQLKSSDLKLTDAQADSVASINMEFMQQMRGMRDLTPEQRQAKMKEVGDARQKRWAAALKDDALAQKVADYYEKQRQQRMQNGGGRPNGGGGGK